MESSTRKAILAGVVILGLVLVAHSRQYGTSVEAQIDAGTLKLEFEPKTGYLRSLLSHYGIPISSQSLVFGRNSFQIDLIYPERPRAIYFNDDTYIGYVQGGKFIEVTTVDPKDGPLFFTVRQETDTPPKLVKETDNCIACHDSAGNQIPRLLVLSTVPDAIGTAMGTTVYSVTDQTPLEQRFGGWYVTGTHGSQRHMGNVFARERARMIPNIENYIARMDLDAGANVTNLSDRFDTKPYLTPHSDIVAQLVLAHQTHVHNMISRANHMYRRAVTERRDPDQIQKVIEDYAEPVVKAMLFSGAQPYIDPIAGTTSFASDFAAAGRRDKRGRSLKDLDLQTRLFKYPMSYVIYTESFKQMPQAIKDYVDARFYQILAGEDTSKDYAHLSAADRQAILEILRDTQ